MEVFDLTPRKFYYYSTFVIDDGTECCKCLTYYLTVEKSSKFRVDLFSSRGERIRKGLVSVNGVRNLKKMWTDPRGAMISLRVSERAIGFGAVFVRFTLADGTSVDSPKFTPVRGGIDPRIQEEFEKLVKREDELFSKIGVQSITK